MEFYIDMAVAILLRVLSDKVNLTKYRRAMQKVYLAIDSAYNFSGSQIGATTPMERK